MGKLAPASYGDCIVRMLSVHMFFCPPGDSSDKGRHDFVSVAALENMTLCVRIILDPFSH